MPELPEVETVRQGLRPFIEGARIEAVQLNRADLRFPFPEGFAEALTGATIVSAGRRAKYLLFALSNRLTWLSHLGMSGAYRLAGEGRLETGRYYPAFDGAKHDHASFALLHPEHGALHLIYSDPRRFGFMDLFGEESQSPFLAGLGPEPLGNEFNAQSLALRFTGRKAPIKAALLDQRNVAGLGNIYVCEALWRAHIAPTLPAGRLVTPRGKPRAALEDLVDSIRAVLLEAVAAGGSTLRDFRNAEGGSGYFQHRFSVYDREGGPCPTPGCTGTIARIVQSGRSTFFCPVCQTRR
jgi:formamidopyrimidine-DNA glycosylase